MGSLPTAMIQVCTCMSNVVPEADGYIWCLYMYVWVCIFFGIYTLRTTQHKNINGNSALITSHVCNPPGCASWQ